MHIPVCLVIIKPHFNHKIVGAPRDDEVSSSSNPYSEKQSLPTHPTWPGWPYIPPIIMVLLLVDIEEERLKDKGELNSLAKENLSYLILYLAIPRFSYSSVSHRCYFSLIVSHSVLTIEPINH